MSEIVIYNFMVEELSDYFAFEDCMTVEQFSHRGIDLPYAWDGALECRVPVRPHQQVYLTMQGMSMGFPWGLYFANEAVAHMVSQTPGAWESDEIRDRLIGS